MVDSALILGFVLIVVMYDTTTYYLGVHLLVLNTFILATISNFSTKDEQGLLEDEYQDEQYDEDGIIPGQQYP